MAVAAASAPQVSTSRAVRRRISGGSYDVCPGCDEVVKFVARAKDHKVICNVYEEGTWNRVEHWHETCYAADEPYGPARD